MKKFLLILLTLSMLFSAIPFSVSAEDDIWETYYDDIPWDNKYNYIDYDNEDGHKTEGYRPGKITVFMTEEFMSTHEAPVPADFNDYDNYIYFDDYIDDIIHKEFYDYNEFDLIINWYTEQDDFSKEHVIEGYIMDLYDLEGLKNVEKVRANYIAIKDPKYGELTDFQDYDDYYYYKNEDCHKESGYVTDCILFNISDEFKAYLEENFETNELGEYIIDVSIFPELQDKIIDVEIGVLGGGSITLEKWSEHCTDYTEEYIDEFIGILESVYSHPMVVFAMPNFVTTWTNDPIDPPDSETDDTTTDTEEETPEATESEETTVPETTVPETTTGESENTAQKNHQTGDELYILMALMTAAVLTSSVLALFTAIKKRKASK